MAKPSKKPKPVRPGAAAGKWGALIATAVIVVGLGIVVVLNRGNADEGSGAAAALERIVDLVPEPLADDEMRTAAIDPAIGGAMPELEAGGWIQIVDRETGRLAQQYRFARLDPTPEGLPANWVRMDQPRAVVYLANNRVVRLSGDSALVHLPHRVLKSGSLTGNVLIEVFEPPADRMLDDERDDPVLVVHAPEAAFDNVMGEVTCPDRFRVESPSLEFLGNGLSLLINDQTEPVRANMEIAHLEYARFAQGAAKPERAGPPPAAAPTPAAPAGTAAGPDAADPAPDKQPQPAEPTPSAAAVQYYELTLRDNVKVQEGIGTRVVTGDTLVVLFTTESEGFTAATPAQPAAEAPQPAAAISAWLAGALFGQVGADDVVVQQPVGSRSIAPPIRDNDIYVTCTGGLSLIPVDDPARAAQLESPRDSWMVLDGAPVALTDRTQDTRAACDRIEFRGLEQAIRLVGSDTHPLTVTAPQLDAAGEVFWIRRGTGGFEGPGWLSSTQDGQSDAEQVRLTWSDGLDLGFDETPANSAGALGNLRQAVFRGDVVARSDGSMLSCNERLVLDLDTDTRGATAPTLMTAIGDVRASDPEQTMWSDRLAVTFAERDDREAAAAAAGPAPATGMPDVTFGAGSRVDEVMADGNLQVLLSDGARVFADRLDGNAARETVTLTGENVAIANKQWLIDEGHEIALDRVSGTALWPGRGVARMFGDELPVGADDRIDRAALPQVHQSRATWNGSMRYSDSAGDGNGVIELGGGVEMVSEPDPLQRTTFSGDTVTIELSSRASGQDAGGPAGAIDRRAIGRVLAHGNARLEQRRWVTETRADEPRIFFVSGDRIEYDEASGEAVVPGPGELLTRDLRPAAEGAENADAFAARGTTSFRWTTRLKMTRRSETLYDIAMVEGIEMRHLDLAGESMTLTCSRIDATIDRPERSEIDGPADLQHVRATGEVFLRTPTRDVDCDLFDYDVRASLAIIEANPGRLVTIFTRGAPQPVTLRGARWNLATDEITASAGTAGGTRK